MMPRKNRDAAAAVRGKIWICAGEGEKAGRASRNQARYATSSSADSRGEYIL